MDITSKLSDKVKQLEGSAIREMFKLMQKPGIISFAGGSPDSSLFPNEKLAEISERVLRKWCACASVWYNRGISAS